MKEGRDLRCIKWDATESKISKKLDYFSNKMPDCLPKNKFLSKTKQISEKQFRNLKSRLNFDTRGIKIKKIIFFEILVNIWVSATLNNLSLNIFNTKANRNHHNPKSRVWQCTLLCCLYCCLNAFFEKMVIFPWFVSSLKAFTTDCLID